MTHQKMISNVVIKKVGKKLEYYVPTDMNGKSFVKWQKANKEAIAAFKEEETNEQKEEPG